MEGSIILHKLIDNDFSMYEDESILIDFNTGIESEDYYFNAIGNINKMEEIIPSLNELKKEINGRIEYLEEESESEYAEEDAKFYRENIDHLEELFKNANTIKIDYPFEEAAKFIKNNPELKSKKVVIIGKSVMELNKEELNKMESILGEDIHDINFELNEHDKYIPYETYLATINKMDQFINNIELLNLSPIEKIMYVYDIVRDRVYKKESKDESKGLSRDFSSALLGENIVCEGYANIFNKFLNKLGIDARMVKLQERGKDVGHARSMIYVKDDKYDIDGIYYFDPTWDSRKIINGNNYLNSYKFFALTRNDMCKYDKEYEYDFIEEAVPVETDDLARDLCNIEDIIEENGLRSIPEKLLKAGNHYSAIINGRPIMNSCFLNPILPEKFLPDKDEVIDDLYSVIGKIDTKIPAEKLIKILYNVRKMEYYINPEKYKFDIDAIFSVYIYSNWLFDDDYISKEEKLYRSLFGNDNRLSNKISAINFNKYLDNSDLERDIARVRVAKALRLVCDKKKEEN